MVSIVAVADLVAYTAHFGQTDLGGNPYIAHPRAVADLLETDEEKVIALLHDVMEDTVITEAELRPVFGDAITDTLLLLTRPKGMDYMSYIQRIKSNPMAKRIKLADLAHNSDLSRIPNPDEADYKRLKKYEKAKAYLLEE